MVVNENGDTVAEGIFVNTKIKYKGKKIDNITEIDGFIDYAG